MTAIDDLSAARNARIRRGGPVQRRVCATLTAFVLMMTASATHATVGQERAPSGAKATVGLAMLGAEATLSVEALVGVKPWWGYALGGGLGAVAGGVGGYFIDRADLPSLSMGLLAGGIVFAVPVTIGVLSATAYRPPGDAEVDQAIVDRKLLAIGQAVAERHRLPAQVAPSPLLALHGTSLPWKDSKHSWPAGGIALDLPSASLQPVFSAEEMSLLGLRDNVSSVRLPLLNLSF